VRRTYAVFRIKAERALKVVKCFVVTAAFQHHDSQLQSAHHQSY